LENVKVQGYQQTNASSLYCKPGFTSFCLLCSKIFQLLHNFAQTNPKQPIMSLFSVICEPPPLLSDQTLSLGHTSQFTRNLVPIPQYAETDLLLCVSQLHLQAALLPLEGLLLQHHRRRLLPLVGPIRLQLLAFGLLGGQAPLQPSNFRLCDSLRVIE